MIPTNFLRENMSATSDLRKVERQLAFLGKTVSNLRKTISTAKTRRRPGGSSEPLAAYLALTPALTDDAILHNLLRCAMHVVRAGGAGLTLFDANKQRLVFRAALGDGAAGTIGEEVPLKGSQHGLAFATGEVQSSTTLYKNVEKAANARFRNVLVAPMIVNGEPVGTISAVNKHGDGHFSSEDMAAFKLFAEVAAMIVRQRCREQILRKGLSRSRTQDPHLPVAFNAEDRALLHIFNMLADLKHSRPELLR